MMMNTQRVLVLMWCGVLLFGGCSGPGRAVEGGVERGPNFVIIFVDDMGYGDLSSYGHPTIRTPALDRMASEGMKLSQFYVAAPVCSPSRAALLTGCYPKRVGMEKHVVFPPDDHGLHTDEVTIADVLQENGYATGCFGKWHLGHREGLLPTDQGFDEYFGVPYSNDMSQFHRPSENKYAHSLPLFRDKTIVEWEPDQHQLTKRFTEAAVDFIDRHHDEPFLVYLPHSMPHIPIYASEDFAGTSARGLYGDVIEEIDWSAGEIRGALARHGIENDTLVIFTSDNGPWLPYKEKGGSAGLLRGGKGTTWEGGMREPFIAVWPGRIPAGVVSTEVVTALDVLPTIAEMADIELAADRVIDGHDVTGILVGEAGAESPTEYFLYYTSRGKLDGIRRGPWKLMLASGELYHLEHDVSEQWDKARQQPELVEELRELAEGYDAAITAGARPVGRVAEPLWDPAERHRRD